jgi:hypothetical protein
MITAVDGTQAAAVFQKQFGNDAMQQLQARFQELMAHGTPHAQGQTPDVGTLANRMIASEDAALQQIPNDTLYMMQTMQPTPGESVMQATDRLAQESMYMSLEMTRLSTDLTMKMSVVNASKDGIKSLLKNQ